MSEAGTGRAKFLTKSAQNNNLRSKTIDSPWHHRAPLFPISAVFPLRYPVDSGAGLHRDEETGDDLGVSGQPAEWYLGPMGIRPSDGVLRAARCGAAIAACVALANCAASNKFASRVDPQYGVSSSPRVVAFGEPVPKGGGTYRVGKPYVVSGRIYVPEEDVNYREDGFASWYGDDFHGRLTANGEVFDMAGLTAAHPTLPMPCYARVTNLSNHKSLIVRVNDRGPYHGNRLIDLSHKAAEMLEFRGNGVARVRVEYVGPAPLEGTDDRVLMATLRTGAPAPAPSLIRLAAARPFVPEFSGKRIQGDVPMPVDRPYTLGTTKADLGSTHATSEISASRRGPFASRMLDNPRSVSYENDPRYASELSPVSAYAPVDPSGRSELLSGRGLY
jgi:peptidoglycan lytic transglycosylase